MRLDVPVAFIVFNRPDTTQRVFERIRAARPSKLLVISDGARPHKTGEAQRVAETRAIIDGVDWDCEVLKNYSDTNLGCRNRVSSGITWVFEQVERAIILEDDCLPHETFFGFCRDMLDRYADDSRVMHIGGANFQPRRRTASSYYFSIYTQIWGWASWRRAWKHYDVNLRALNSRAGRRALRQVLPDPAERYYWKTNLDRVRAGFIDTWDYQWLFACWLAGGLTIIPEVNLVSNIGFGPEATHTTGGSRRADNPTFPMDSTLIHPDEIRANTEADRYDFMQEMGGERAKDALKWGNRTRTFIRFNIKRGLRWAGVRI